jgi:hypothetical protein
MCRKLFIVHGFDITGQHRRERQRVGYQARFFGFFEQAPRPFGTRNR